MDREILFRGKSNNTNKWEFGLLGKTKYGNFIIGNSKQHFVDENTIGQYTGLTDKNGTKIFEGDIIYDDYHEHSYLVKYLTGWGQYILDKIDDRDGNWLSFEDVDFTDDVEVIGNIHDNPELLEAL